MLLQIAANLQANGATSTTRHLTYSYYGKSPELHVYDSVDAVGDNAKVPLQYRMISQKIL